ncbi:CoA-binding protein [Vagococcus sp. CY52-2]|uniref:CoA-binding protein n=1 Tax=Vagococcus sp. CY52-2 TaxID=2925838 RepID=UPI001F567B9C|nr:CoA-binding protein [Vagococcus sp. CY52-2]UNM90426.1 CoA-binding protein [Vagococcus sp. CY52-2]
MAYKDLGEKKVKEILTNAKTIAVVGLSDNPEKTSYRVAEVMQNAGYKIIPVNPMKEGKTILGEKVYPSIESVDQPIDIVDVFRPSSALVDVAKDFLKSDAPVFWAQLGIENDEAADLLYDSGITDVIMNRCIKIELQK